MGIIQIMFFLVGEGMVSMLRVMLMQIWLQYFSVTKIAMPNSGRDWCLYGDVPIDSPSKLTVLEYHTHVYTNIIIYFVLLYLWYIYIFILLDYLYNDCIYIYICTANTRKLWLCPRHQHIQYTTQWFCHTPKVPGTRYRFSQTTWDMFLWWNPRTTFCWYLQTHSIHVWYIYLHLP